MRLLLAHSGHYLSYGFAIAGIAVLFGYDAVRRRRRQRP
jgi:hypothetical protein